MLLKSITLKDFRQFKGKQKIEFASGENRNVTVILGDNTSGKTTFVQAFNWALYGTSSFATKDFLLNMDVAREMAAEGTHSVEVEIELRHGELDYIITRVQNYNCDKKGDVRPLNSQIKVSYKQKDGQREPIRSVLIENTINSILPKDLANYFFFDGERIGNISNKQDVTDAVKGLLGLAALDNTIKHLDPNKKNSVIGKLNASMDIAGNQKAENAFQLMQSAQDRRQHLLQEIENNRTQCAFYENRKDHLEEMLRNNQVTAELQKKKEERERLIVAEEKALEDARKRFFSEFNTNTAAFFSQPLLLKANEMLKHARVDDKGVPNMNGTSIDFIIKRGRCICGTEIVEGNEQYKNLINERCYLPPQSIGTMIRIFSERINSYNSTNVNFFGNLKSKYEEIYRLKERIDDWSEEVEAIGDKIKDKDNMNKCEDELRDVKKRLREMNEKREALIREDESCAKDIELQKKRYESFAGASGKNKQIALYIKYAEAVYRWVQETYTQQEREIREKLEMKVNEIFSKMYHGHRRVEIDSKYRVSLFTHYGEDSVKTDESRGLETVKNFAFIAGLVDLAREKINSKTGDVEISLNSEPYPLVMDAPFSNADEKHVSSISKMLPKIAEQVIMVVMDKDWTFAENTMGDKVGKKYRLEKQSETLTYIKS